MADPSAPCKVHRVGGTWGFHVTWFTPHEKLYGHMPLNMQPDVGDVLVAPMKSGRDAVYIVTSRRREMNPDDMFWLEVEAQGYADDPTLPVLEGLSHVLIG